MAMDWGKIFQLAGTAASAYSKSRTDNRSVKTADNYMRDVLRQNSADDYERAQIARANMDVLQRRTESDTQGDAWKRSLQAALVKNWAPTTRPKGVANISFVGNGFGPEGLASADLMQRAAQSRLANGPGFAPMNPLAKQLNLSEPEKESLLEKITKLLGPGLSIAGALKSAQGGSNGGRGMYSGDEYVGE